MAGSTRRVLTYWRRRLLASDAPNRIFDAVREVIAQTGAVKGKTRRALDSTVLDDAVATQDTVTQLIAIIRKVRRDIPAAAAMVARVCTAHDYDDPGKPQIAWDDSEARQVLISALVNDALALLAELDGLELDAEQSRTVALLALLAGQDVEPAEDSDGTDGRWRIARKVAPDRVISVVDPEARHAHKTVHRRQDGFKAHVAVEPDTGLVTACELTKAAGSDAMDGATGIRLLNEDTTLAGERVQVLGDSAYGTGDALKAITDAKHTPLVKPWPLKPTVPDGFTLDDFSVDETAGTATCPTVSRERSPGAERSCSVSPAEIARCALSAPRQRKSNPSSPRARRPHARAPAASEKSCLASGLPQAPAHGRTLAGLARRRREPQAPLPRNREE
jgi:hypothetical protein